MDQVQRLIDSGVRPLELYYQSVISTEFKAPCAYRSQLRLSDPDLGVLLPEQYLPVALRTVQSVELACWNLNALMDAADALREKNVAFDWLSMYAPVRMLMKTDMSAKVEKMLGEHAFIHPEQILFEFPEELLYEDTAEAGARIRALKENGVKVAVAGFGSEFCPAMRLGSLSADAVIMDARIAAQLAGEQDTVSAAALIDYALETGASVVLDGAEEALADDAYRHNAYGLTGKIAGRHKKLSTLLKQA